MKIKKNKIAFLISFLFLSAQILYCQQLAFPTAEGYGKYTVGGRGGKVIEVTNLNDSGEGSLRAAVEASGPRTIVFKVSGTIELKSALSIKNPYITIAGQTAPGDGICIRNYPLNISADEVIIRYIRLRLGDESGKAADAISSRYTKNIILDHISASWSVDETMSIYHCENVTVQWCLITESLFSSVHAKGTHGFGGIFGANYSTYHHNLLAHHTNRNPRFASGCGNTDFRNNVIYNWGYQSSYGGEKHQKGNEKFNFSNLNVVANYYKPGPATKPGQISYQIVSPSTRDGAADYGKWYVSNNFMEGNPNVTEDNWSNGIQPKGKFSDILGLRLDEPRPAMAINQQSPTEAYASVLENAGANFPKRDAVDLRIIEEVRKGKATFEGPTYKKKNKVADTSIICGIIDSQNDVGGWPELKTLPAPKDSDHDGIPDAWEKKHGLNPKDKTDGNKIGDDGYTMLEKFINSNK